MADDLDHDETASAESAQAQLDQYLAEISARLPGPGSWREDLLTELRDGLFDATERHQQFGSTPSRAMAIALRDSGPAHVVAAAYTQLLRARQARRTAFALLLTGPIIGLTWLITLTPGQTPDALLLRYPMVASLVLVAAAAAALTIAATGRLQQWLPHAAHLPQAAVGTACIATATCDVTILVITCALMLGGTVGHPTALVIAASASATRFVLSQRAARRHLGGVPLG